MIDLEKKAIYAVLSNYSMESHKQQNKIVSFSEGKGMQVLADVGEPYPHGNFALDYQSFFWASTTYDYDTSTHSTMIRAANLSSGTVKNMSNVSKDCQYPSGFQVVPEFEAAFYSCGKDWSD